MRDIDKDALRDFLRGALAVDRQREVLHKLLRYPDYRRAAARIAVDLASSCDRTQYDSCFDRAVAYAKAWEAELANERREANRLVARLETLEFGQQWMIVASNRRYHTWCVCERLLQTSWSFRWHAVGATQQWSLLAVVAVELIDVARYGSHLVADLRARCWAHVANAKRIQGDFVAAELDFHEAFGALSEGTGDPLERAKIIYFQAMLRLYQERFDEGHELLDRAQQLYLSCGDREEAASMLAEKGVAYGREGKLGEAVATLREALATFLDPDEKDCRRVQFNLATTLIEVGELSECQSLLDKLVPLYESDGDELNIARCYWLEGQLGFALGRTSQPAQKLLQAREVFLGQALWYEAAQLSLELALVYARGGWPTKVLDIAVDLQGISKFLPGHAASAVLVFTDAAEANRASELLCAQVKEFLEEARDDPGLTFSQKPKE